MAFKGRNKKPQYEEEDEAYDSYNESGQEEETPYGSVSFGSLSKAQAELEDDSGSEPEGASSQYSSQRSSKNRLQGSSKKSKHAPSEVSAKKPVSVIRELPGTKKETTGLYRDIRFDPAYGKADLHKTRANYAFLNSYRENELKEMKDRLKVTKDDQERSQLNKAIMSLSSRLKTLKDRDFEHEALQKAKRSQPDGKYLTRKEKREFVLKEKLKTMKKKDIDRAIERRRKKVSSRERKQMPDRRSAA